MSEALVTALQGRLDRLDAMAREAAKYSSSSWRSPSSAVVDFGGGDLDALVPVPASPIAYLIVDHDPESVLRLCRAHRDLIELHQPAGEVSLGDDDDPESWRKYCRTCGSGEPYEYPAWWPCATLQALARGLGVEEQSSE